MPKLRNGNNGDSNPGSLDCESGILPTELPRSVMVRSFLAAGRRVYGRTDTSSVVHTAVRRIHSVRFGQLLR